MSIGSNKSGQLLKRGGIMKKNLASFSLTFVVMLWGLSFALTKPLLSYMGVFNFLSYRFVIGGVVLAIFLVIRRDFNFSKDMMRDAILAGAMFFAVFGLQTLGLKHTSIAKNAFIVGSSAIFIPFVKIVIFKTKQDMSTWLQVLFATTGLALITLTGPSGSLNFGDIVTLIGTILFAYYTIFIEQRINKYDILSFTTVQLLTVGCLSMAGMILFEIPTLPHSTPHLVSIISMGIFLTGFAYIVSNMSQRVISALSVTIIYTLEPFFAAIFGWVILSEVITSNMLIGAVLIFSSMLIPTVLDQRGQKRKTAESYT